MEFLEEIQWMRLFVQAPCLSVSKESESRSKAERQIVEPGMRWTGVLCCLLLKLCDCLDTQTTCRKGLFEGPGGHQQFDSDVEFAVAGRLAFVCNWMSPNYAGVRLHCASSCVLAQ